MVLECSVDLKTDRFYLKIRNLAFQEIITQKIVKLNILIIFYAMVMVAVKVMVRHKYRVVTCCLLLFSSELAKNPFLHKCLKCLVDCTRRDSRILLVNIACNHLCCWVVSE